MNAQLNTEPITKIQFGLMLLIIIIIGIALRLDGINRGFEYDEIWPFQTYRAKTSMDILFLNSDPCNFQPLSNILSTISSKNPYFNEWHNRKWAFFWGIGTIVAASLITIKISSSISCGLIAALLFCINPVLVHYSQTARGYEMQYFFSIFFLLLICSDKFRERHIFTWTLLLTFTAWLMQISVITSVMIWGPMVLALAITQISKFRRKNLDKNVLMKKCLIPIIFFLIILGIWLIYTFPILSRGQVHGKTVLLSWSIIKTPIIILQANLTWPILFFALISIFFVLKNTIFNIIILLLFCATACAVAFGLGPPRVYTYLTPFILIWCSIGCSMCFPKIKNMKSIKFSTFSKYLIYLLFLGGISFFYFIPDKKSWEKIDFKNLIPGILQATESNSHLIIGAGEGRCAKYYSEPEIINNNIRLLSQQNSLLCFTLIVNRIKPSISCYNFANNKIIDLPVSLENISESFDINNISCYQIKTRKRKDPPENYTGPVFAIMTLSWPKWQQLCNQIIKNKSHWFFINVWLKTIALVRPGEKLHFAVFVSDIKNMNDWKKLKSELEVYLPKYYFLTNIN